MRIIAWVNSQGNSGPAFHRIIQPLMAMEGVDVYITNNLLEEHFENGCDIFMYNRILPDHCLDKIAELKEKYGFAICVDIDDYWELDESHVLYNEYKQNDFATKQIRQLMDADFVTTTHSRLADEIKQHNENVYILPNAIPHTGQFKIQREPYYLTRIFWQGSITHLNDMEILRTPIKSLQPISKEIKMIFGGYVAGDPISTEMARIYTADFKHQYQLIPGAHVSEYYKAYENADICLIPLVNSKFNQFKSNLKVLEAANLGLPVIASKVNPYLDLPIQYARCSQDWVTHITRMAKSKKRRRDAGHELKEYCDKHYNFNKINEERKQIFEHAKIQA